MTDDIVERLRSFAELGDIGSVAMEDAADEIVNLRAALNWLRGWRTKDHESIDCTIQHALGEAETCDVCHPHGSEALPAEAAHRIPEVNDRADPAPSLPARCPGCYQWQVFWYMKNGDNGHIETCRNPWHEQVRDEIDRLAIAPPPPAPATEAHDRSWLCFHCDERFTDHEEARQHFGEMRTGVALCQEPRDLQDALRRARDAENRWMDLAAKLGVERTETERLAHMLSSWERQFGTADPREAWNRLDSMEGRAMAAEERLSAPPPPAPATEGKP